MSLNTAFQTILSIQSRAITISRPGTALTLAIKAAPSNYFRNLEGPSDMVVEGREFVVAKNQFNSTYPAPKRGDRLVDGDLGNMSITEVREMFDLGGGIIGYRMRIS
jgi:hypothetical protein